VAAGPSSHHIVFTCEDCGLPFLAGALLPHDAQRCDDCTSGVIPPDLPVQEISAAAENEVRAALATTWRFVTSTVSQAYVDRIARLVGARIPGAPRSIRVVFIDAPEERALALPSGTLMVSTGLLAALRDEAELAFVLGHEISHAASGEVAERLVRLGFKATARERGDSDGLCWSDAAVDLVRLGFGRRRERDADARALEALLALDYDPQSAIHYLNRLHDLGLRHDPRVAEIAVAHPTPLDRIRRIERALSGRVTGNETPRVNREVFRRAIPPREFEGQLVRVELDSPSSIPWTMTAGLSGEPNVLSGRLVVWIALGAAAAVALATYLLR
jgi:predicted Zn-dependent protease